MERPADRGSAACSFGLDATVRDNGRGDPHWAEGSKGLGEAMISPETREAGLFLDAYRRLQPAPDRLARKSDLSAEAFVRCLGNVFIVEARPEGYHFRLFGTRIAEVIGEDHTGDYLHDVLASEDHAHVADLLRRCLRDHLAILSRERLFYSGKAYVEVEILRTPWSDENGVPRFVAGTLARLGWSGGTSDLSGSSHRIIEITRDSGPRLEFAIDDGAEAWRR